MPLRKFADLESAFQAMWGASGSPELPRRNRHLWERTRRLAPVGFSAPRGVTRFRSIEEANEERDERIRRRVLSLRDSRRSG